MLEPLLPLQPGENYRFFFDATRCIGCKCCEVACHEQNNNPPEVKWRQVGEIEGGTFPHTKRLHISMSCNHCLDPACLNGCPVDAYHKDEKTGIVFMREDVCIGCQYCTWNCPYGAPQFNEERGMVTKCDMCHHRIEDGRNPACVEACPSQALAIERFDVEAWREDISEASAPGIPDAAITYSTTRIKFPQDIPAHLNRIDEYRVQPEKPHYSLILLTVLTQLAVGGFVCLFTLEVLNHFLTFPTLFKHFVQVGHLTMLGTALLALSVSVCHLGRPLYAMRALKMWRRSWLSREVLFFALFAGLATLYSLMGWQNYLNVLPWVPWFLGSAVTLCGLAGVHSSAMIYRVAARPSWNTLRTTTGFFATAFLLGSLLALTVFTWGMDKRHIPWQEVVPTLQRVGLLLMALFLTAGFIQIAGIVVKLLHTLHQEDHELRASAVLLTQKFRGLFLTRLGILFFVLIFTPFLLFTLVVSRALTLHDLALGLTLLTLLTLACELMGRYLFFVTVVPKKRPAGYF